MVSLASSRFYTVRGGEERRGEERRGEERRAGEEKTRAASCAAEQPQKKTEPDDYLGPRTKDTEERGVDGHPYRSIRGPGYIPTYGAPGSGQRAAGSSETPETQIKAVGYVLRTVRARSTGAA